MKLSKRNDKPDLNSQRRALILTAWMDYRVFGCLSEAVLAKAREIRRLKEKEGKGNG